MEIEDLVRMAKNNTVDILEKITSEVKGDKIAEVINSIQKVETSDDVDVECTANGLVIMGYFIKYKHLAFIGIIVALLVFYLVYGNTSNKKSTKKKKQIQSSQSKSKSKSTGAHLLDS